MLYYLFNYLEHCNVPGAGMFNYVTFRAAMAIILSLIISVWFGMARINVSFENQHFPASVFQSDRRKPGQLFDIRKG